MIHKRKTDSIIEEIHKIRREIADRFDGDIRAISSDADARMVASGCPVWKPEDDQRMHRSRSTPPFTQNQSRPGDP